jgi:hypothetical protein
VIVGCVVLASCFIGDPINRDIAMQLNPEGEPVIIGTRCDVEGLTVRVFEKTTDAGPPPGQEPLWEAESTTARGPLEVEIGHAPPGFRETIPLATPLDPDKEYAAEVDWSGPGNDGMFFTPSNLPAGREILTAPAEIAAKQAYIDERTTDWCGETFPLDSMSAQSLG